MNYENEAKFSNALVPKMRKKGWFIQRIESGTTGKGIPDIYALSPRGVSVWLELKREHADIPREGCVEIHWRPGQQAWLSDVTARNVPAYTLACFNNGILKIAHKEIWEKNLVPLQFCEYYKDIGDLLS